MQIIDFVVRAAYQDPVRVLGELIISSGANCPNTPGMAHHHGTGASESLGGRHAVEQQSDREHQRNRRHSMAIGKMSRRALLMQGSAVVAGLALPRVAQGQAPKPRNTVWRCSWMATKDSLSGHYQKFSNGRKLTLDSREHFVESWQRTNLPSCCAYQLRPRGGPWFAHSRVSP
jgi:hypothetical protein